jgi:hypothetical protein
VPVPGEAVVTPRVEQRTCDESAQELVERCLRHRIVYSADPRNDDDLAAGVEREGLAASIGPEDHEITEGVQLGVEVARAPDFGGLASTRYGTLCAVVRRQEGQDVLRQVRPKLAAQPGNGVRTCRSRERQLGTQARVVGQDRKLPRGSCSEAQGAVQCAK